MSIKKLVTYQLPNSYIEALRRLRMAGYSDDGKLTQVSAIRQAIEDAWESEFPGEPFPSDEEEVS